MSTLGEAYIDVVGRTDKTGRQVERDLTGSLSKAGEAGGGAFRNKLKAALAIGGGIAAALGLNKVVGFFKDAVGAASDFSETANKVNVIFGGAAGSINKFAATAATKVGLSAQKALDAATTFGAFGKQAKLAGGDLSGFSTGMVTLAADLASFNNTSPEAAVLALGSAFKGEYEQLDNYNILMNAASVQQEALRMGLIKTKSDALDPTARVLATQSLLMQQATDAAGDFGETSDGLANKQRILAAQFDDVKRRVGVGLLPVVLQLVGIVQSGLPVFEALASALGTGIAVALAALADGFATAKEALAPFLPAVVELGRSLGEILGQALERLASAARPVIEFLRENLLPLFAGIVGAIVASGIVGIVTGVAGVIASIVAPVAAAGGGLSGLAAVLVGMVSPVALAVAAVAGLVAGVVYAYRNFEGFRDVVDKVVQFLIQKVVPKVVEFAKLFAAKIGELVAYVQRIWPDVQKAIERVLTVVVGVVKAWIFVITKAWQMWGDDLLALVGNVWDFIGDTISNALDLVKGVIKTVLAVINGDWGKAWDGIKQILSAVWAQIQNIVDLGWDVLKALFGVGLSSLKALFGLAWSAIVAVLKAAWGKIKELVTSGWAAVKSGTTSAITAVVTFVTSLPGRLLSALGSLASGLGSLAKRAWDAFDGAVDRGVAATLAFVKTIPGKAATALGNVATLLKDKGKQLIQGFINGIEDKIRALRNAIGRVMDVVGRFVPGSPVREGPLKVFNQGKTGKLLMEMFADGIEQGQRGVRDQLSGLDVSSPLDTGRLSIAGIGSGGGAREVTIVDQRTFEVSDASLMDELRELLEADRESLLLEITAL